MTIRVLPADDQELVRAGFRMILETQADIEVAGEAGDRTEAVAATLRLQPDVVLVDIRMPNLDGLQATKQIVAAGSGSRVGILTTFDLAETCTRPWRQGRVASCSRTPHLNSSSGPSGWSPPATLCWPVDHPPGHRAVHPPPTSRRHRCPCGAPNRERDVFKLIAQGAVQRRDRRATVRQRRHGQEPRWPPADQAAATGVVQAMVLAYESGLIRPGIR